MAQMSDERMVPAIVIGLGIAGVTASVYLSRMGIEPLAFDGGRIGGHINKLERITDYAGFVGSGEELSAELSKQLEFNKIEVVRKDVKALYRDVDGSFVVKTDTDSYKAKAVVMASGLERKFPLEANGVEVVDDPLHDISSIEGKDVAVVGGGRVAYQGVLKLSTKARKVYFLAKNIEAPTTLRKEVESLENVEFVDGLDSFDVSRIYDLPSKSRMVGNSDYCLVREIVDDQGNIAVGKDCQTFVKGIFAAGDIIQKNPKSLAGGVYDGAICGVMIYRLITGMNEVS